MAGNLDWLWPLLGLGMEGVNAWLNSRAITNAANTQLQGGQQAIDAILSASGGGTDLQKQMFGYQQQLMKPYYEYGTGALQTLGDLMGIKPATMPTFNVGATGGGAPPTGAAPPAGPAQPPGPILPPPTPPQNVPPQPQEPSQGTDRQDLTGGGGAGFNANALTRNTSPGALMTGGGPPTPPLGGGTGAPPQQQPQGQPQQATMSSQYSTVTVKWPDGSTSKVPVNQLARYTSLGAQPVGTNTGQTSAYSALRTI